MATVHVMLCAVSGRAQTGASLPVPDSALIGSETLTLATASVSSSLIAERGMIWRLTVRGADVWVAFAMAPDASVGDRWQLPEGVWEFHATAAEKVAVQAIV